MSPLLLLRSGMENCFYSFFSSWEWLRAVGIKVCPKSKSFLVFKILDNNNIVFILQKTKDTPKILIGQILIVCCYRVFQGVLHKSTQIPNANSWNSKIIVFSDTYTLHTKCLLIITALQQRKCLCCYLNSFKANCNGSPSKLESICALPWREIWIVFLLVRISFMQADIAGCWTKLH